MKYAGLDLGSKTLGLAVSESGIIASAYDTLIFRDNDYDQAVDLMVEFLIKERITCLVIGYPKHMNNDIGIRAQLSESFKEKLLNKVNIEIILWDERLSTKQALQALSKQNQSAKVRKSKKDTVAAMVILQNYLNFLGGK